MHVSSTARRYGRSLARVAIAHRLEKTVGVELDALAQFFDEVPLARLTLESPATSGQIQERLIQQIESIAQLSPYTRNTLRLLVENRRFPLFGEIREAYRREIDRYHGVVEVEVTSAQPLDDTQREALKGTLQRSLAGGNDVRLDLKVDPRLIAGIVAKVGSSVWDGSLRNQLGQIKQQLISE